MRILIVDDSPTFLQAAGDAMEGEGYEVETAPNGAEGLRMARALKPNLIVMDIEMPVMRGNEAAREIKNDPELANTPIIAMTSVSPESLGEDRFFFDDYLIKPFGFVEMIPMVRDLLNKSA
jgi:CheY-like chemotaxis protein